MNGPSSRCFPGTGTVEWNRGADNAPQNGIPGSLKKADGAGEKEAGVCV